MTDPDSEARIEPHLRSSLEHLIEGAQIIDREWRYLYLNPAAARQGGRSVEELAGQTMMDSYPGIEDTEIFAVLRGSMLSGRRVEMKNEFVLPDGTHKWFKLAIQPVPEGLFILSVDITDREQAEDALRTERARLQAILDNLHEGLILSDLNGNLLHWNHAALAMLGFETAEARRSVHDLENMFELHTTDGTLVPIEDRPLTRVLRGEHFQNVELRITRVGQQWERIFLYSGSLVHYSESEAIAFVTIADITERKELERHLLRAQRLDSIGTLASGIAHDLNNILMPILMGATILRRFGIDPRTEQTVNNIERSAKRGGELVRQVLSFARGVTAPWSLVGLADIIEEVEAIVRSTFPKNVTLSIDIAHDAHAVSADPTQLLQVLLNLCVNARDAMPNGGQIKISVRNRPVSERVALVKRVAPGDYVALVIADEGTGMPDEVLEHIFDSFFTTKEPGKGTGLGLSTVHQIMRSHGGFIDVSSQVGKGTTFRAFLPAHVGSLAGATPPLELDDLPWGNGELIMVVDDEATILSVTTQALEAFGYKVITAKDGAQAIVLYSRHRSEVAAVVTDMMMPIIDGERVIAVLLQMNPELHIIATSGSGSEDWIARAESAGAKHVLPQPYTATRLLRMLADIISAAPSD